MTSDHDGKRDQELAARALTVMPGGASHDGRQLEPVGLFIHSAKGARKIGTDGRSYIDFACGNGALLLGHGHKASVQAASRAIAAGFHFSAGAEIEVRWAEQVRAMMPAAQQVRFTSSGNEACLLAMAVSHAATGKAPVLVLSGHYHGWATSALLPRISLDGLAQAGSGIAVAEAPDTPSAIAALATSRFGAIIVEPTGASFGKVPLKRDQLLELARAAKAAGALCIFDETITGFRVAPGGAQQLLGIAPDLIVLGKILGGGLPCGALAGRRDLMKILDNRPTISSQAPQVSHMGTGNGNPVVASVGVETLLAISSGEAIALADTAATRLRSGLNLVFAESGVPWAAYGSSSGFHIFLNPRGANIDPRRFDAAEMPAADLAAQDRQLVNDLRIALIAEGIDINPWPGGLVGSAHDASTVDEAISGFARALFALSKREMRLSGWGDAA
jgi:glutamate-1-semialdehyde 2,1-aminomutase